MNDLAVAYGGEEWFKISFRGQKVVNSCLFDGYSAD